MFTVLVGRPGIGKGQALNPALSVLKEANTIHTLSDRVTIEYVLERLAKGFPSTIAPQGGGVVMGTDSSSLIYSPELSIFITASQHTLPILADLWDSREGEFSYGTRHKGDYTIKNACISMLAGSTQEWLISSIPSNAVGGGFTRRVNFVFAKERQKPIPWPSLNHGAVRSNLVNDLRHISQVLKGEFTFDPSARLLFEEVYQTLPDEFDDEATTAHKTSAWAHATKLAMALAAARDDKLCINKEDMEIAIKRVGDVTTSLALVFRAVGESDLVSAGDRVLRFLEAKGFASKSEILRSNWRHISAFDLDIVLATFVSGNLVSERSQGNQILYYPIVQTRGVKP